MLHVYIHMYKKYEKSRSCIQVYKQNDSFVYGKSVHTPWVPMETSFELFGHTLVKKRNHNNSNN